MSDDARATLEHQIDAATRSMNHEAEDLSAEANFEQAKLTHAQETAMLAEIRKYAAQNGYTVVLEGSGQQAQVLWAATSANITAGVVRRYDEAHPVSAAK